MQDNPHIQGLRKLIIINVTSISPILHPIDIKIFYIPIWQQQTLTSVSVLLQGVCVSTRSLT